MKISEVTKRYCFRKYYYSIRDCPLALSMLCYAMSFVCAAVIVARMILYDVPSLANKQDDCMRGFHSKLLGSDRTLAYQTYHLYY